MLEHTAVQVVSRVRSAWLYSGQVTSSLAPCYLCRPLGKTDMENRDGLEKDNILGELGSENLPRCRGGCEHRHTGSDCDVTSPSISPPRCVMLLAPMASTLPTSSSSQRAP